MIRHFQFIFAVMFALVLFGGLSNNCIAQANGIVSTSGQIAVVAAPASVRVDSDQADVIHLFLERQRVRLRTSLKLDAAPNRKRLVIPAGTMVDSYFARLEPTGGKDITASASITFNKTILGAISSDRLLDATDPILGRPGTQYETGVASRGLESGDTITFQNITSASITTDASRPGDELRIITVAGPADGSTSGPLDGEWQYCGAGGPGRSEFHYLNETTIRFQSTFGADVYRGTVTVSGHTLTGGRYRLTSRPSNQIGKFSGVIEFGKESDTITLKATNSYAMQSGTDGCVLWRAHSPARSR